MEKKTTRRQYFNTLIRFAQKNYVSPKLIKKRKLARLFFKTIAETDGNEIQKIRQATDDVLRELDKKYKHSFLLPEWPPAALINEKTKKLIVPHGEIKDGIAYISLPPCGGNEIQKGEYACKGNALVTKLLEQKPIGFIIDLRENSGGDCLPMLATVAPLLAKNNYVGWVSAKKEKDSGVTWVHHEGRARNLGKHEEYVSNLHGEPNEAIHAAVLYGNLTRSSGEVTALALKWRPLTESFGTATGGYTTANDVFDTPLAEVYGEGKFALTLAVMADRHGKKYGGPIKPDVETNNPLQDATQWIRRHAKPS